MKAKETPKFIPMNEAVTDFTEIKGSHYNVRIPNFGLLPTKKFIKFDGAKIIAKLFSHYNIDGEFIPITVYGEAICDPDNKYTKGFGIDLAFRKASENMERQCKRLLIAYSKDHMIQKSKVFDKCSKPFKNLTMTIPKGHRNNELLERAKVYKHTDMSRGIALIKLKAWNNEVCDYPLPEKEVEATIDKIYYKPKHKKDTVINKDIVTIQIVKTSLDNYYEIMLNNGPVMFIGKLLRKLDTRAPGCRTYKIDLNSLGTDYITVRVTRDFLFWETTKYKILGYMAYPDIRHLKAHIYTLEKA